MSQDAAADIEFNSLARKLRAKCVAVELEAVNLRQKGEDYDAARLEGSAQELLEVVSALESWHGKYAAEKCFTDVSNPRGWVVIDTNTGAMDGLYLHQPSAQESLLRHQARHPVGNWFLFALHSGGSTEVIPEGMFWRNRLAEPLDQSERQ